MEQREEMFAKWQSGHYTKVELAELSGVSRPTLDLWIGRGEAGEPLQDRPSIPRTCPHRTAEPIAERILEAKRAKPLWGPKKLITWLGNEDGQTTWPGASAAGRILAANGLVRKKRTRREVDHIKRAVHPLGASESGEMMTIDHKGWFRLGNCAYCYPLTINDPVSRFIYQIGASKSTAYELARTHMEPVFREHGVPKWIGSDNGGPFCCTRALGGLSRLSVWWIRLGITPIRIHPGCPWENGIHERMHKTLKAHTARPPAQTMKEQQARFDAFRHEFNHERPHEALAGTPPVQHLKRCAKQYSENLPPLEYPGHCEVRRVRPTGMIKWQGDSLFVSETLSGECVALEEIDDAVWSLRFAHIELARFDERTKRLI